MAPRRLSTACRHFEVLRRRARARLLHWIASGAVIDEGQNATLDDRELATLSRAIERARRAGR